MYNYKNGLLSAFIVKKGMLEKAEQGTYPSFAPYGYINVVENGKRNLRHDPQTAPFVRRMFELYATGQYSLLSLKNQMLADGMVYRNGKTSTGVLWRRF
jgi:site-specific DNA recombinase